MTPSTARKIMNDYSHCDGEIPWHGWHLIGPGQARFGWGMYSAAGDGHWLGRTAVEAVGTLRIVTHLMPTAEDLSDARDALIGHALTGNVEYS